MRPGVGAPGPTGRAFPGCPPWAEPESGHDDADPRLRAHRPRGGGAARPCGRARRPHDRGVRARGGRRRPRARRPAVAAVPPGRAGRQVPAARDGGRVAGPRDQDAPGAPARPARHRAEHAAHPTHRGGLGGRRHRGVPAADARRQHRARRGGAARARRRRPALGDARPELRRVGHDDVPLTGAPRPRRVLRGRRPSRAHRHGRRRLRAYVPAGGRQERRVLRPLPRRRRRWYGGSPTTSRRRRSCCPTATG